MTTTEMLRAQFDLVYGSVEAHTWDLTQEESLAGPTTGGNCANWILGHLTNVQNQMMALVGAEPVWTDPGLDRNWNDPVLSPDEAFDFGAMRGAFLASKERCLDAVAGLSDADLARGGLPHPFGGTTTLGGLLALLAFHQAYHSGQLALARRVAGREGVFKQPGS